MKQRKRPTAQGSSNRHESNNISGQGPDSASAFSSSAAFHTSTSTSSSSSSSSTIPSSKTAVKSNTTTTTTTTKSKTGSNKADAKAGLKPAAVHSQTMLLELLLTVTRSSLVIVTPLVAGMILRVAPSMMEPIYGSIFIEEGFLEYSLASVIVGVVLAMIYTFLLNKRAASATAAPSTSSSLSTTATAAANALLTEATSAGLRKDAGLRRGIAVSLDLCGLVLASAFLTTHIMFKHSGEFGPWRGPHLTQLVLAYPLLALLGFANTLACVLRSYERVHIRTWISCVLIQVGTILGLTLVVFQMAPQGQNCPRVYSSAILVVVISSLHKCKSLPQLCSQKKKKFECHFLLLIHFLIFHLISVAFIHSASIYPR